MFQPGSTQRDYSLCSQYDDALDLPAVPEIPDDADDEAVKARDAAQLDRDQKLKVARERSDWATLIKPGRKPTVFTFRQIPRRSVNWLIAERDRHNLSHVETLELMFRLAISGVDGFGQYKLDVDDSNGHELMTVASLDKLYDGLGPLGAKVVIELGSIVMAKTLRGVSPL